MGKQKKHYINPRLSSDKIDDVVEMIKAGYSHREIKNKVPISFNTLTKIRRNLGDIINSDEKRTDGQRKRNYVSTDDKKKLDLVEGYSSVEIKALIEQKQINTKKEINETINKPGKLKLGVISDTHLNNYLCKIEYLQEFYKLCEKEGVQAIVHAGDLTDGLDVYPGQIYDLMNTSFDKQAEYIQKNYPKAKDIKTYFISGNHDESWLKKAGINFGEAVSKLRDDMIHLGFYNAKIYLNGFVVELQHGGGGSPYAISYHLQKYMERIPSTEQIDVFILGHFHRELVMMYRGTLAVLPGAFLGEGLLAKRYKLGNNIAGRIITLERDSKGKVEYSPKLIKYE